MVPVAVQALEVAGKGPRAQLVLQDLVVRELFLSPLLESFLRSAAVCVSKGARQQTRRASVPARGGAVVLRSVVESMAT